MGVIAVPKFFHCPGERDRPSPQLCLLQWPITREALTSQNSCPCGEGEGAPALGQPHVTHYVIELHSKFGS